MGSAMSACHRAWQLKSSWMAKPWTTYACTQAGKRRSFTRGRYGGRAGAEKGPPGSASDSMTMAISAGSSSPSVLGVLVTTVFHTCSAAAGHEGKGRFGV